MIHPPLLVLLLPPLPRGALHPSRMPFLSRLVAQAVTFPLQPAPLGLTSQTLLAAAEEPEVRLSGFAWEPGPPPPPSRIARAADRIPRFSAFRPFRRWIARRWERRPLEVDPAFVPSASLASLRLLPLIDPDRNLCSDLEESGLGTLCSLIDYPWLPQAPANLSWIDAAHERDFAAWGRAAISSGNDFVCLELGHRLARRVARRPESSPRIAAAERRLDGLLRRLLSRPPRRFRAARYPRRRLLILSPEQPLPVRGSIDLLRRLETEHFLPGRDYVAVVHPAFVQAWEPDGARPGLLRTALARLPGLSIESPARFVGSSAPSGRGWGDFLALADRGLVFHPNHFDGRTPRRRAAGWAADAPSDALGFAAFSGSGWNLPPDVPRPVGIDLVRHLLLGALSALE